MIARDVELLDRRLHELNERTVGELGLAACAFGLALASTQLRRDLAVPLLVGALALTALGLTAFVRRRLLVEDAAADRDTYELDAVRRYARRMARPEQRRVQAAQIRRVLAAQRFGVNRAQLRRLIRDLEREDLELDPACAVALDRLLHDPTVPADEFRSRLVQVEAGFRNAA